MIAPIDCAEARTALPLYLDDELGDDDRNAFERHLAACAACREAVAADRALKAAIRDLPRPGPPPALAARIRDQLPRPASVRRIRPWHAAAPALAAGLLLFLLGGVIGLTVHGGVSSSWTALSFVLLGGLVASDARLPLGATTLLAALLGLGHGYLNGAALAQPGLGAVGLLGIVAAVLGVIKTMGAITEPPEVLGEMIGSALVGTFLGVLLAYGFIGPFANRARQVIEADSAIYHVVKQIIIASLHGHPLPLVIEAARSSIAHANQPAFADVFDGMRAR